MLPVCLQTLLWTYKEKNNFGNKHTISLSKLPTQSLKIAGDLNVRMHSRPSSHTQHVGPHVWGLREDHILPEPNNRTYLLEFLSTFSLHIPASFRSTHPQTQITYADMTPLDTFPPPDPTPLTPTQNITPV